MVERRLTGVLNMFNPNLVSRRDVLVEIRAVARRALLIPVRRGIY